jgi:hypothetical protein
LWHSLSANTRFSQLGRAASILGMNIAERNRDRHGTVDKQSPATCTEKGRMPEDVSIIYSPHGSLP